MSAAARPAARPTAASPEAFLASRAQELAVLESAALVLSPALDDSDLLAYNEQFEALHEQIDGLSALLESEGVEAIAERAAAEFAEIGSALSSLLLRTRDQLLQTDLSKLRPAIPQLARSHRPDVESVLDLCLGDLESFDDLWPLTDLLIGRLATNDDGKVRKLRVEPSQITPRLTEVCDQAAKLFPAAATQAVATFEKAIADLKAAEALEDLEPIIERLFSFKQNLGMRVLLPEILRAAVLYNMAVANRIDAIHLGVVDEDGDEILESVELDLDFIDEEQKKQAQREETVRRPRASMYEHEGLVALTAAIRARLGEGQGPDGPARVIAAGADLSKLEESDREILLGTFEGTPPESLLPLLVVGLVVGQVERIGSELALLGIDPEVLEDEWVPEVRNTLRAEVRDLIRRGHYEETRGPSQALTRLLPIWQASDAARRRAARPVAVHNVSTDGIDLRSLIDAAQNQHKVRRVWGAKTWLAVGLAVVALVMVGRVAIGPMTSIRLLDETELHQVSPHLDSGQRDQFGYGSAMVAKLDASWHGLDADQQYREASEIARKLRAEGVTEVVLIDAKQRLQVRISNGRVISPERPE